MTLPGRGDLIAVLIVLTAALSHAGRSVGEFRTVLANGTGLVIGNGIG
jgi:hypothetical protein